MPTIRPVSGRTVARVLLRLPPAFYGLAIVTLLAGWIQPHLLSLPYILVMLRQAAPLGVVALGQAQVMSNRTLDLSVGGVIALTNVVLASAPVAGSGPLGSIGTALGIGLAVGAVNGLLVAWLRASAVIATLATWTALSGLALLISGGAPGGEVHPFVRTLGSERIGSVPVAALIWVAVAMLFWYFRRWAVYGRATRAAGDASAAARLAGIPVVRLAFLAYVVSGLCAAIAGVLLTGYIGTGTLGLGRDYVLNSIAAVILAGTTFGGGSQSVVASMAGAFLLIAVFNLLTVTGLGEPAKLVLQGLIILVAAALHGLRRRKM